MCNHQVLLCFTSGSSAARCASVIEYGVEKFMTIMHMSLEVPSKHPASPRQPVAAPRVSTATAASSADAYAEQPASTNTSSVSTPPRSGSKHHGSMSMDAGENWLDMINSPPKPEHAQVKLQHSVCVLAAIDCLLYILGGISAHA
jgi:hypothetical protein